MRVIWGSSKDPDLNDALATWIAGRIWGDHRRLSGKYSCMGVFDGGELAAAVAFHNWSPEAGVIEFTGAAINKRWLTRPVLWAMFDYPFNQLGCQMVIGRNDPSNAPLKRMETAYGFKTLTLPRMRGRDKDELLMMLTDDAWRANGWHKENAHGK